MPGIKTLAQGAKEVIIWQVMRSDKLRHGLRNGGVLANCHGTLGVSANQEIVAIFQKARSFLKAINFMMVAGNAMVWNIQKYTVANNTPFALENVDPQIEKASKEIMDFRKLVLEDSNYRLFQPGLKRYGLSFSDLSPGIPVALEVQDAKGEAVVLEACQAIRVSSAESQGINDDLLGY